MATPAPPSASIPAEAPSFAGNLAAQAPTTSAINQLRNSLDGDVLNDEASRRIHAADASLYEQDPLLVVRPRHQDDVAATVRWAAQQQIPITARGAGTSLAGQTTGAGIVLDLSRYLCAYQPYESSTGSITVEPGVIRDDLNDYLAPIGMFFAPETATTNRCTIGGMIANNSCGTHSPAYGSTRDHVVRLETVLADGSLATFEALTDQQFQHKLQLDTLEGRIYRTVDTIMQAHREDILAAYPKPTVTRRNTGYALDCLAQMRPWHADGQPCSLVPLICGSEGTLAMVTKAQLQVVERPRHRLLIAAHFSSVVAACRAAVVAVEHRCYAGELIDGTIIGAARNNREQQRRAHWIDGEPGAVLAIELEDSDAERVRQRAHDLVATLQAQDLGHHHPIIEAADIDDVWALRQAGLGLLMGIPGARKAQALIEDAAVAPNDLPAYVEALDAIMAEHDVDIVYYAHAAAGELHPRPELDVRDPNDLKKLTAISRAVAKTIKGFGGSLSGEHGDGRVRAPFIELVLGSDMLALLTQVKQACDPQGILNPHKIINPQNQLTDLRTNPNTPQPDLSTAFDWSQQRGLVAATEACNGAGVCRKSVGRGTMCPSYHATKEEAHTTRGRANLFRRLLTSAEPLAAFRDDDLHQALDWCLGCKACASECPANVDMARLKAEHRHQRHQQLGIDINDRRFGRFAKQAQWASRLPRIANWLGRQAWFKRHMGIDPRRSLPAFATQRASSLAQRWQHRAGPVQQPLGHVVLCIDEFTEYLEPELAIDALRCLHTAGWQVDVVTVDSGRAQLSRGLLDEAREAFEHTLDRLQAPIAAKHPLIGIEPSAILGLVDEAPDLVSTGYRQSAQAAAQLACTFEQFIADHRHEHRWIFAEPDKPRAVLVHGHCHQKALIGMTSTHQALAVIPQLTVTEIASGCCGMAGSFGYQHFDLSMTIGEQVLLPELRSADANTIICAAGTSCRHQIADGTGREALHPASILAQALA